jgi:dihydroneopterin aldolase
MTEISLEGLEFYAYHGFYKEEQEIGNKYSLDIKIDISSIPASDELRETINYEDIYNITKQQMEKRFKLLETIANNILSEIFLKYPQIDKAEVSVSKFNPPLGGICQRAKVVVRSKNKLRK